MIGGELPQVDRPLLILDIDETLLYATERPLSRACDYAVGPYAIYLRPHVHLFVSRVAEWFDLAVWTSSTGDYASLAIEPLFPRPHALKFLWSRERCTRRYDPEFQAEYFLKDLKKVRRQGYLLERVLMIDDSPEKLGRHYGNHIRVTPFVGDPSDSELQRLLPFLDQLRCANNFREVEKRNWRAFTN